MMLTGPAAREFQTALTQAFPTYDDLAAMALHQMEESLSAIAGEGKLDAVTFRLIQWANARGRTQELIDGALAANPDNPQLRAFARTVGQSTVDQSAESGIREPIAAHRPDRTSIGGDQMTLGDVSDGATAAVGENAQVNITHNYYGQPPTPGNHQPIRYIHFLRNTHFQGRQAELRQLHKLLHAGASVGIHPATGSVTGVTGMGGIGKTQLAVEYAYRHLDDYPGGIFWINAVEIDAIQPRLVNVAELLRLRAADPASPDRSGQMLAALAAYLRGQPQTLLIFDNVEDPALLMQRAFGPNLTLSTLGGVQLLTTRLRTLPVGVAPFPLDTLRQDPQAAHNILTAIRPDLQAADGLAQLCERMDYLPLGLNFAARLLGELTDLSISDYLAELDQLGLDQLNAEAGVALADYEFGGLTPVFEQQWRHLQTDEATAADACHLLQVAGQLGAAAVIPIARLSLLSGIADVNRIRRPLTRALARLENLYFIERLEENAIRLHPLVRDFAASRTPADQRPAFRQLCANHLTDAYEDLSRLVDEIAARGVAEVQEDLITALELTQSLPTNNELPATRLTTLNRLLQREAHSLTANTSRTGLAQQIAYRVAALDLQPLMESARHLLSCASDTFMRHRWSQNAESSAIERTLTGHEASINAVAVFDQGRKAISASDDRTLRVWNLRTGQVEQTITGHDSSVRSVAAFDNGRKAISASADRTLKVWDLGSGRVLKTLTGHEASVNAVVVFDNGRKAISASSDCTLRVWDLLNNQVLMTLADHKGGVNAVAVYEKEGKAISASDDRTLKIWDLESGRTLITLTAHEASVRSVAVFDHGSKAISASNDGTLKVWNLQTCQIVMTLVGHENRVTSIAVTKAGCKAISTSWDKSLKIWNLQTEQTEQTLIGHEHWVNSVAILSEGQSIISTSWDNTLKIWNLQTIQTKPNRMSHMGAVMSVAIFDQGRKAISASSDLTLMVWDLETGMVEQTLAEHKGWVTSVTVFDEGRKAISASWDETLKIWELGARQAIQTLSGHETLVNSVSILEDDNKAISASVDGILKLWNLQTGQSEKTHSHHTDSVNAIAVFDKGNKVISASSDRTLKVWDLLTGQVEMTLSGHQNRINAIAVFDQGRKAISASSDRSLKVWNLSNGQTEMTICGHQNWVNAVAVFDDGRKAISASADRTLRVWNLVNGEQIASIMLDGAMRCVAVHEDVTGITIVAGDAGGGVYCLEYVEPDAG
ncbi:MAG: effector-associated domain EAD1-containing protein [Caldilineaceae bacterium]